MSCNNRLVVIALDQQKRELSSNKKSIIILQSNMKNYIIQYIQAKNKQKKKKRIFTFNEVQERQHNSQKVGGYGEMYRDYFVAFFSSSHSINKVWHWKFRILYFFFVQSLMRTQNFHMHTNCLFLLVRQLLHYLLNPFIWTKKK